MLKESEHYTSLEGQRIRIDRVWEMPNKYTFQMKYVKQLLNEELKHPSIDPFAGYSKVCSVTNDINPNLGAMYNHDALEFLEKQRDESFMSCVYDAPYTIEQFRICYHEFGQKPDPKIFNAHWQSVLKDNIARILKPGGTAICFGFNSNGIGKGRGFRLDRILLVAHGRVHNDLICTVESKINSSLAEFLKSI